MPRSIDFTFLVIQLASAVVGTCRQSCEQTIKDLKCQYLNLYLMHWPDAWEPDSGMPGKPDKTVTIQQTWSASCKPAQLVCNNQQLQLLVLNTCTAFMQLQSMAFLLVLKPRHCAITHFSICLSKKPCTAFVQSQSWHFGGPEKPEAVQTQTLLHLACSVCLSTQLWHPASTVAEICLFRHEY